MQHLYIYIFLINYYSNQSLWIQSSYHPSERHSVKTVALNCNGKKYKQPLFTLNDYFHNVQNSSQLIKLIVFMMIIFCRAHFMPEGESFLLRRTFLTPQNINANYFQSNYFNTKSDFFSHACKGNGGNNFTSSVRVEKLFCKK